MGTTVTAVAESFHEERPQATQDSNVETVLFDRAYLEGAPPWDIEGPQPAVLRLERRGAVAGRVLDVGCGTGENALFLAGRGYDVVGIDASPTAIARARRRAGERGLAAIFVVGDALDLGVLGRRLDTVLDSGLLHVFSDADRARVVEGARTVLRPGGRYLLMCFNEDAAIPCPRRFSRADLRATFADGWRVESIEATRFTINEVAGWDAEGPAAWLACVRRLADAA
jgi:SAM-dependent methyltransferase